MALGKNLAFMHSCVQIMMIYPLISRERSSGSKEDTQGVSENHLQPNSLTDLPKTDMVKSIQGTYTRELL